MTPVTLPWELSTATPPDVITGYNWELYNVKEDPTEFNDLAAKMPDKLKDLQDLFYSEAKKYDVLPLDNSTLARWNTPRPSLTAGQTEFTYSDDWPLAFAAGILAGPQRRSITLLNWKAHAPRRHRNRREPA